jgi:hypothetical protein
MSSQYLTKTELAKRWSLGLIERFFPTPSKEGVNPIKPRYAPMQLYNIHDVRKIESSHVFRIEWEKTIKRKIALKEMKKLKIMAQ